MGCIRAHLLEKFEFHSYGHALEILEAAFPGLKYLGPAACMYCIRINSLICPNG